MRARFVTTRHLTRMYTNTSEETAVCSESVCFGSESNRPSSPWQTIPGILNKLFIWTSSLPAACLYLPLSLSPSKATDWAALNESGLVCAHTKHWPNTATPMTTHTHTLVLHSFRVKHLRTKWGRKWRQARDRGNCVRPRRTANQWHWDPVIKGLYWQAQPSTIPPPAHDPSPSDHTFAILPRGSNRPQD